MIRRLRSACPKAGVVLCLIAGGSPAAAQDTGAIDVDRARACFAQARELSDREGGRMWGAPLYGPMLFVDPQTRAVVANQPDAGGTLRVDGDVAVGTLPPEQNVANTAFRWSGQHWTMLMWPPPQDRYRRGTLLMHELFHRLQRELDLPGNSPPNEHLDTRDGRLWLRLEMRALGEALLRRGERQREALTDALAFRARRHALFPEGRAEERQLELNEGLAEYTGLRASGLPRWVLPDRAAIQLAEYDRRESLMRSFAYATGPAYGLLLDAVDGSWHRTVDGETDLARRVAEASGIEMTALDEPQLLARSSAYLGAEVLAEEDRREATRQQRQAAFRQRFQEQPTLVLPAGERVRYSYNPHALEAFDGVGTVYLTTRVTDAWGVLEVSSGGALMIRENDRIARFLVPAPAAPLDPGGVLAGDGWRLELAEGWRVATLPDGTMTLERE
ncbi:MAG: hypothetical protein ACYTJ0_11355 [Planctomycetota bacterium]|jgi:hypothetical protein